MLISFFAWRIIRPRKLIRWNPIPHFQQPTVFSTVISILSLPVLTSAACWRRDICGMELPSTTHSREHIRQSMHSLGFEEEWTYYQGALKKRLWDLSSLLRILWLEVYVVHLNSPEVDSDFIYSRSFEAFWLISNTITILAINIRTALNCHNSFNFNRNGMIFFSFWKFASLKNLSNETKLAPVSLFVWKWELNEENICFLRMCWANLF